MIDDQSLSHRALTATEHRAAWKTLRGLLLRNGLKLLAVVAVLALLSLI